MKKPLNTKAITLKLVLLIVALYVWYIIYVGLTNP